MVYLEYIITITAIVKVATIGIISAAIVSVVKLLTDYKKVEIENENVVVECPCQHEEEDNEPTSEKQE